MSGLRSVLWIARHDLVLMLFRREAAIWVFIMPIVFFYFMTLTSSGIGSVTGSEDEPDPLALQAPPDSGFLVDELITRLEAQNFRVEHLGYDVARETYARRLRLTLPAEEIGNSDPTPTQWALAGNSIGLHYESGIEGPDVLFDRLRVARAVFGIVADAFVLELDGETMSQDAFLSLATAPRNLGLDVRTAGRRESPPVGVAQAVPGTLVMFTMLVLTTAGAIHLAAERNAGLFRRLAATPVTRGQIILGKFTSRMALAVVQIVFAMIAGTLLFGMSWGPSLPMVLVVLAGWAAFNASLAMVLGNLARTEAQATGAGILVTLVLAALGGLWWPIELTPEWAQRLAMLLPSGLTMDALHKLVNFAYPGGAVLGHLGALVGGALVLGWVGARSFRYD